MGTFNKITDLNGRVIVIAGGAGQIGSATSRCLAEQGARIVWLVRSRVNEAQEKIKHLPHFERAQHFVIEADITNSESLQRAAEKTLKDAGGCNVLINAAGTTRTIRPHDLNSLSDKIFDEILSTNLRGVFATIRSFAPMLKATGDGLIINISSTAALRAGQSNVAYAAAKAGLNLMTQTLAKSLAPEIRMLAIAPGYLETPTSGAVKADGFNDWAAETSPLKRVGAADDIANTIESCIMNIRFTTGSLFVVDGGRTL